MKFNYSILLFISAIFAQSQSHEDSEDKECYTKMDCKIKDITEKLKTDKNMMQCVKFVNDKDALLECTYKLAGLSDDQIKLVPILGSTSEKCESDTGPQFKKCIDKCASDKSCKETCAYDKEEKSTECLANQYNVKDFDAKKSVQCSKQCDQDTLPEIFECEMKCKEPLYKKITSDDDSKSESDKDSKSNGNKNSTTSTSSKDSKPTGGSSTTTQQSSGFSNLSAGLSVISAPILFALFL
jgi:hypothetical protein